MSLKWKGDQVYKKVETAVTGGLNEFGSRWETAAKANLGPGRGVVTGTYRRSLHYANPAYNFAGDDVKPRKGSPNRKGKGGGAKRDGDTISITLGSGMIYAMYLERRYNVVRGVFDRMKGALPAIIRKHAKAQGLT